jgi:glycyl-tRNA synthetase alpha chain
MYLQKVDTVFDVEWVKGVSYGEVFHRNEVEMSTYAFRASDPQVLFGLFDTYEKECTRLLALGLPLPAYESALKCSHTFNLLDARGAISVTERAGFIKRVRDNARACAEAYLKVRAGLGFPLRKTAWTVGQQPPLLEGAPASRVWDTFLAEQKG